MFNKNPNYGPYKVAPILSYWPSQPLVGPASTPSVPQQVSGYVSAGSTQFLHQQSPQIASVASATLLSNTPAPPNISSPPVQSNNSISNPNHSSLSNLKFSENNLYFGSSQNMTNIRSPPLNTNNNLNQTSVNNSFHNQEVNNGFYSHQTKPPIQQAFKANYLRGANLATNINRVQRKQNNMQQEKLKPTSVEYINFIETPFGYQRATTKQGLGSKVKSTNYIASSNVVLSRTASNGNQMNKMGADKSSGTSNFDEEDPAGNDDNDGFISRFDFGDQMDSDLEAVAIVESNLNMINQEQASFSSTETSSTSSSTTSSNSSSSSTSSSDLDNYQDDAYLFHKLIQLNQKSAKSQEHCFKLQRNRNCLSILIEGDLIEYVKSESDLEERDYMRKWAIYMGNSMIMRFDEKEKEIKYEPYWRIASKNYIFINRDLDKRLHTLPIYEILNKARFAFANNRYYSKKFSSAKNFAMWCRFNINKSDIDFSTLSNRKENMSEHMNAKAAKEFLIDKFLSSLDQAEEKHEKEKTSKGVAAKFGTAIVNSIKKKKEAKIAF